MRVSKKYLVLDGSELQCFKKLDKSQLIFFHTLPGCFIKKMEPEYISVSN